MSVSGFIRYIRESSLKKLKKVSFYDNILYCNHILKLYMPVITKTK